MGYKIFEAQWPFRLFVNTGKFMPYAFFIIYPLSAYSDL